MYSSTQPSRPLMIAKMSLLAVLNPGISVQVHSAVMKLYAHPDNYKTKKASTQWQADSVSESVSQ